jgi:probable phosphoglycerate mutase
MPIVYMLRHAQSVANTKGILAGRDNSVALSKMGQQQSRLLVPYLSSIKFSKIYSSPLLRCIQTIEPFMQANPDLDFKIDERFIEMDYGNWSGRRLAALSREKRWRDIQSKPSTFTFPDGESFRQMRRRVDQAILDLKNQKSPILIITHGDIIKMAVASLLNLPIDKFQSFVAEPASLTIFSIDRTKATLLQSNYKISKSFIKNFKDNQLGGGNSLSGIKKWWQR